MKSHWIEHKGKKVFIADYSGFGPDSEALRAEIEPAIEVLAQQPLDSTLVVALLDGTAATISNSKILKDLLPKSNAHVHRRAVVGMTGTQFFLLNSFNKITGRAPVTTFGTLEQALEWIIQD
jgi:hypothetical protein